MKQIFIKYWKNIVSVLLFSCCISMVQAQNTYYWVGKGADNNWSNLENWEVNGLKPSEIPDISDQVIVDDSKFSTDQTIIINQNAVCLSVDMTALATHNITIQTNGNSITVNGDFKLSDKVSIPISSANLWAQIPIRLTGGNNGQTYALSFGGKNHPYVSVSINANGAYLINEDTQIGRMILGTGTLEVSSGKTLDLRGFLANSGTPKTLKMAGATILSVAPNWSGAWKAKNFTLEDDNASLIKLTGTEILMEGDNVTYNKVEFGDSNSSNIQLTDQVTIKNAIFYAGANFATNGITFHDLVMNPGTNTSAYSFGSGVEISVTNSLQANGSCTNPLLWTSATQGKVNFTGTNFTANHINVNGVTNSSSNTLTLNDSHSLIDPNATNDQGWVIVPSTSRDLYWIGGTDAAKSHNWSDVENWAVGSVLGTQATCIPDANDNVFFEEASFTGGGSKEVTVDLRSISCQNMTWSNDITVATNPTFKSLYSHSSSTPNNLFIYGSLKFDSNMNQDFVGNTFFKGSGTITSEDKTLKAVVFFNTSGTYSLVDAFKTSSNFYLQSGTFDLNNQDFSCAHFLSRTSETKGDRTLKLRNSKLYISLNWLVASTLSNPATPHTLTIEEGTSTIYMTSIHEGAPLGAIFEGGVKNYYNIEFTNTGAKTARLYSVNTVKEVRVKNRNIGIGDLYVPPHRINTLIFSENSSGSFYGNNSYGDVTLDPGQIYTFHAANTQTIDVKLTAAGTCSLPITLKSDNDNASATLNLSSLDVSSQYLLINRVNAVNTTTANVDFVANNSQNIGNTAATGWSLTSSSRTLYWVGSLNPSGAGNWGNQANWSLSSGGTGGVCLPTPSDDVIFDALSFSGSGSQEVNMNTPVQTCKNMTWTTDVPNTAQWKGNNPLEMYGSFTLAPNMTNNYDGAITFKTANINATHTIDTKGVALNKIVVFSGDATWNLLSNLKINNNGVWGDGRIILNQGTFDLQGNDLDITWFQALNTAQPHKLVLTNATVTNVMAWEAYSTNFTLEANNSLIEFVTGTATFNGGSGLTYHDLHFKTATHAYIRSSNNITFNNVTFDASTTNAISGTGHTFKKVTFNANGGIGGSHTFEELIFTKGNQYSLESGQTQTIQNNWSVLGGNCSTTIITSSTEGQAATVTKSTGTVEGTFLTLKDIQVQGGATFNTHFSVDQGGNTGWNFLNSGVSAFAGLGNDIQITPGNTHTLDATVAIPTPPAYIAYKWYKDGQLIVGSTGSTLTINEPGIYSVTVCFDVQETCCVSDVINVTTACNYKLSEVSSLCSGEEFCVWLEAKNDVPGGIIGMDYCLSYDPAIMTPTGQAELGSVVQGSGNHGEFYINHQGNAGQVYTSIYYNTNAPTGTYFSGKGQVICIKFRLKPGVLPQEVPLSACQVRETYSLNEVEECADLGKLTITDGAGLSKARVIYWNQANGVQPLAYDANNPTNHLITNITGVDDNCENPSNQVTNPDLEGYFVHTSTNGSKVQIKRDIEGDYNNPTTNVTSLDIMSSINGMDCYYLGLITTFNTQNGAQTWVPSAYQMLAADVNMNDVLAASDITLIQQRTVLKIQEYPQLWNYDYSSSLTNPVPKNVGVSYDWRFVNHATLSNADFQVASNYPVYVTNNSVTGYWRDNVPDLDACQPIQAGSACDVTENNTYYGILLGDIDGNWTTGSNAKLRTTTDNGEVIFDLLHATKVGENTYRIPVKYSHQAGIHAIDFSFDYNPANIKVTNTSTTLNGNEAELNMVWNAYKNQKLLLTSYSMKEVKTNEAVYYIEVTAKQTPKATDFNNVKAYLNGQASTYRFVSTASDLRSNVFGIQVSTYPNPASKMLTVTHNLSKENVTRASLINTQGGKVEVKTTFAEDGKIIMDVSKLASSMYILQLHDKQGKLISSKKIFVNR